MDWQAKEEARRAWMAEHSLYRTEDEHSSCGVGLVAALVLVAAGIVLVNRRPAS